MKSKIWFFISGLFVILSLVSCKQKTVEKNDKYISVNGYATIEAAPDQAEAVFEVKIYDRIAVTAMENSRKNIENISASLKETGVNEKDISISESMIAIENGRYVISTRLKVLIRNIKNAPAIIDSSMGNGKASELISYKLLVSDISDLEKQVRLSAIQNAYDNAKLTATANGVSLGPVTMIQDITNHLTANYVNNEDQTITLASSVYINYELTNE